MEEGRGGGEWRTGVEGEGLWNVGGGRGRGHGHGRSTCPSLFCKPAPKALGPIYSPIGRLVKSLKITQLEGWRSRLRLWPSARVLARREFANWSAGDFLLQAGNLCLGRLRPGQLDMQDSCLTAVSWGRENNLKNRPASEACLIFATIGVLNAQVAGAIPHRGNGAQSPTIERLTR